MLHRISKFLSSSGTRNSPDEDPTIVKARDMFQRGDIDQAISLCRSKLGAEPKNAEACNLMGGILLQQGKADQAHEYFQLAAQTEPEDSRYQQGLGISCYRLGRLPEALHHFQRALALDPGNPSAYGNLGNFFRQVDDPVEAIRNYRKAISADRTYLLAYVNLAEVLDERREFKAAIRVLKKALRTLQNTPENQQNLALVHYRLGITLRHLDRTDEAIDQFNDAIERQPDFALAHNSLGGALLVRNEIEAAIHCFRRALQLEPRWPRVHSNLLLAMNYLPRITQDEIYRESLNFNENHCRGLLKHRKPFRNLRNKKKRLKIGYLSPDFVEHSIAFFTRRLIGAHDRNAFEVFCYADVEKPDDLTAQFRAQSDQWRPIEKLTDDQVANQISEDRIDILIDLAGHTGRNRLSVFARKPAPIQLTWLGYPNTTGIKTIDYRITDAIADPEGDADRLHSEKLIRLENGFLCYQPDESLPDAASLPCKKNGYVTFGSFNTIKKVTPEVIRVWSTILKEVDDSRLILKSVALEDTKTKGMLTDAFCSHGIDKRRIKLISAVPRRKQHMQLYSKIDIALDPFPYNGTTTSCEALWMGVPVITLLGERHAGRVGASILHHARLNELIARDELAYIDTAKQLAGDLPGLSRMRRELRNQLCESALLDLPRFTRTLEDSFRNVWIKWCNKR